MVVSSAQCRYFYMYYPVCAHQFHQWRWSRAGAWWRARRQLRPVSGTRRTIYQSEWRAAGWWTGNQPLWLWLWLSAFFHSLGVHRVALLEMTGLSDDTALLVVATQQWVAILHHDNHTVSSMSSPLGGWSSFELSNRCLFWMGRMTESFNSVMTSSRPAISLHVIWEHVKISENIHLRIKTALWEHTDSW